MKNLYCLLFCLSLLACNSSPQSNSVKKPGHTGPFDLAKLSLTEHMPDILAIEHFAVQAKDTTDGTMLGYELFKTGDKKALNFGGAFLSGHNAHVSFHYEEKSGQLAGYELKLYSQPQSDTLIRLLGNNATPIFKRTKMPKGEIEIDVNGNEVKPGNSVRQTYRVWENSAKGITYYLTEDGTEPKLTTTLIALKKNTPFSKDMTSLKQLDWYKNEKSE
ncbi:hypothetical protein [Mucilaginibacter pedocola]|uniref:Lipoprotein n=1 Tax=Mucilaginibacter pedocola TaxID=1792845 RepID=A0A1S9PLT9_9SPHI|nr:hypothetical protein [Mucilaginibacter pedocola]OOQ61907.1 hypothetical protein BC343_02260 [Mucilaginibacter pedocola]